MSEALTEAQQRFAREHDRYEQASRDVADELAKIAGAAGIPVETSGRAKDVSSFVKKAILKSYDDAWNDTTDKAGARATVSGLTQLHSLVGALTAAWGDRVVRVEDKSLELDPTQLAYSGVHVQVVAPPREDDVEVIECEVQVRTAAQDVWSVLSHKFVYKPVVEAPRQTKRALMRLVALIEIFDEEVERAMASVLSDPEYPQARLLHDAEQAFYSVASPPYDSELSLEVLAVVSEAVSEAERADYASLVSTFTEAHHDDLVSFFARFAPEGELAGEARYVLGTQPEALVLMERAASAPMLLLHVLTTHGSDWLTYIKPLLAAWGTPLPDPD